MTAYLIRRVLFMIPTLFGIMLVSFIVVQFAPGGPVERIIAQLSGSDTGATSRVSGSPGGDLGSRGQLQGPSGIDAANSKYRGAQGLDPELIAKLSPIDNLIIAQARDPLCAGRSRVVKVWLLSKGNQGSPKPAAGATPPTRAISEAEVRQARENDNMYRKAHGMPPLAD